MITTRDIKVFIFSIFITTLCFSLFNNNPIKEAEAQGGMPPMGAPGMAPPGGDPCEHIVGFDGKHGCYASRAHAQILNGLDRNQNLTGETGAIIITKLDALLAR